ncbi:hypothetical protein [Candidatus Poriferisodalis sp.]
MTPSRHYDDLDPTRRRLGCVGEDLHADEPGSARTDAGPLTDWRNGRD